jgi:Co/Zn/Cd efflux system component
VHQLVNKKDFDNTKMLSGTNVGKKTWVGVAVTLWTFCWRYLLRISTSSPAVVSEAFHGFSHASTGVFPE